MAWTEPPTIQVISAFVLLLLGPRLLLAYRDRRARKLWELGRFEESLKAYQKMRATYANSPLARTSISPIQYQIASCFHHLGRLDEGLAALDELVDDFSMMRDSLVLWTYILREDPDETMCALVDKLKTTSPDFPGLSLAEAIVFAKIDRQRAEAAWKTNASVHKGRFPDRVRVVYAAPMIALVESATNGIYLAKVGRAHEAREKLSLAVSSTINSAWRTRARKELELLDTAVEKKRVERDSFAPVTT